MERQRSLQIFCMHFVLNAFDYGTINWCNIQLSIRNCWKFWKTC